MKVILGLGNPGAQYAATRHNVGWWVLDHLADVWRFAPWRPVGEHLAADGRVDVHPVRLLKPQTYYNRSGDALRPFLRRPFWAPQADLLVVGDDVALPIGTFRLRPRGSAGGSNGLKSIEHVLRSQDYARLRVGTQPAVPEGADAARAVGSLVDFVLSPFEPAERAAVAERLPDLAAACDTWVREGIVPAMNKHNGAAARG